MKVKFWVLFFGWFCMLNLAEAQDSEKIKLKVHVANSVDGTLIKKTTVSVRYALSDNEIPLKTGKKESFYEVIKGATLKVKTEAFQFYSEESLFETSRMYDDDILDIKLTPRPAGKAIVVITDAKTNNPIAASVQITIDGSTNTQTTSPEKKELEIYFEREGKYTFVVEAIGYDTKKIEQELKVNKGNTPTKITIALDKTQIQQNMVVKQKGTSTILTSVGVEITNSQKQTVVYEATNNTFKALPGEKYTVKLSKEGYSTLQTEITTGVKPIELFLEPKAIAPFQFVINETGASTKVIYNIEIKSPSGTKTEQSSNKPFQPLEMGEYNFSLIQAGGGSYSKTATSEYLETKKTVDVAFEVLSKIEITLAVFDKLTKQPVLDAGIKVFNDKSKEIQGIANRHEKTFKVLSTDKLFYEITANGYTESTGNVLPNTLKSDIYIEKIIVEQFQEHVYIIIDAMTNEPILKTQMVILDANNKVIETLFNSTKGTYSTYKTKANEIYTIQTKAEGYKDHNTSSKLASKDIIIGMVPNDKLELILTLHDEYTKEMLSIENLKISSEKQKEIVFKERNREYLIPIPPKAEFSIEFNKEGYPAFKKTYYADGVMKGTIELSIRKNTYPLALVIENKLTDEQKNLAKSVISNSIGTPIPNIFNKEKNAFELESDPNDNLQIEINIPGFRQYKASNNRKQLAMYAINVLLVPIEVAPPVVEVPKIVEAEVEKPKVEEPKIVQLKPEPKPKVEEPIIEKPKPIQPKEEPMEPIKGKRYLLTGVNFEQSSTKMLYGSEVKLKELLEFMTLNPSTKVELVGHTDKLGDERQNQRLSEFRAKAVANWLFNKGIDSERIHTLGKGSSEPIAPNDTEVTKAQNRRIEAIVIEN